MAATIDRLLRKLEQFGSLGSDERQLLKDTPLNTRLVEANRDLVRDGERPSSCILLLDGFACRYKTLEDGRRQIMAIHIPGDMLDLTSLLLGELDHSIATLTPAVIAPIPHATLVDWMNRYPLLGRLLWCDTLVDAAIFREWVVNVGRRPAYARVAHLLCEVVARLQTVGLAQDHRCDLPVTQAELADATGLSAVHVNRTLQELRRDGLIELRGRSLVVLNWSGLKRAAGFDSRYLHQLGVAA